MNYFYCITDENFQISIHGGSWENVTKEDICHKNILDVIPSIEKTLLYDIKGFSQYPLLSEVFISDKRYYLVIYKYILEYDKNFMGFFFSDSPNHISYQKTYLCFLDTIAKIREIERRKIMREIHDGVGQLLTALKMRFSILSKYLQATELQTEMNSIGELIKEIYREFRILFLNEPIFSEETRLTEMIEYLVRNLSSYFNTHIEFDYLFRKERNLSKEIKCNLYRIIQEVLNNALKHSQANNIKLYMTDDDDILTIFIDDDGIGIEDSQLNSKNSFGINNIRNRAKLVGANLSIDSLPQKGTSILITMPLD